VGFSPRFNVSAAPFSRNSPFSSSINQPSFLVILGMLAPHAYNEAFEEIRQELEALERIKIAVKTVIENPIPADGSQGEVQNEPIDRWQISSTLLKLSNSQIFLCERSVPGAKEFAVIEKFRSEFGVCPGERRGWGRRWSFGRRVRNIRRTHVADHGDQPCREGAQDRKGAFR
jgi:hypothetical protein